MKIIKIISITVSLILLSSLYTAVFATSVSPTYAKELTSSCEYNLTDKEKTKLLDSSYKTKIKYDDSTDITVSNSEKMYSVYLVWDKIPPKYTITAGIYTISCGANGFLHEYIMLSGVTSLVIHVPAGTVLCDIRTFAEGSAPSDVQVWQPPCEKADLLLLPTHADDEHLYFGGTMPYYAGELGLAVQVAYFTNHWDNPVRPHEQLNGLWTVGIRNYPIVPEYPDLRTFSLETAKELFDEDEMLGYYIEIIRRFKPCVIVGHDLKGEYGHGAHMLAAELLCRAVNISFDPSQYPDSAEKYGVWDVPKTYIHKYAENAVYMNWDKPLSAFGGKTAFEMAKEGYACHLSQHIYELAVTKRGTASCIWFGLYRSTVGEDTASDPDFMENIALIVEETTAVQTEPPETEPITTEPPKTEPVTTQPVTTQPDTTQPDTTTIETQEIQSITFEQDTEQTGENGHNSVPTIIISIVLLTATFAVVIMLLSLKIRK